MTPPRERSTPVAAFARVLSVGGLRCCAWEIAYDGRIYDGAQWPGASDVLMLSVHVVGDVAMLTNSIPVGCVVRYSGRHEIQSARGGRSSQRARRWRALSAVAAAWLALPAGAP